MDPHFKENIILMAEVIVPDLKGNPSLTYAFIKNFKKIFTGLDEQPAKKIQLLSRVINYLSYLYYFKSFNRLSYAKREQFVARLFDFPVGKIVGGITGMRSLILIAYYGLDEVWESIHYDGPLTAVSNG